MEKQNNICYELGINIDENSKDLLASLLDDLGVDNFVVGSVDCDEDTAHFIDGVKQEFYDKYVKNSPVIIYSEDLQYLQSLQKSLEYLFPKANIALNSETFYIKPIADQNWKESWKSSFKPILIDSKIAILPPWEDPTVFKQKHKIIIDPGMAFGTGQHETTRLCLELMLDLHMPKKVLDVGTGSGILAIAASQLGSQCVLANDIDPDCIRIAMENVLNNNVPYIQFTYDSIDHIYDKDFELAIANIQSKPLKMIIPAICDHISDSGTILLSGILVSEIEEFKIYLKDKNLNIKNTKIMGDWCAFVCNKIR
jgi:ribosomal protein L11 methyltransferase